mgnify:CR=1 FL=1
MTARKTALRLTTDATCFSKGKHRRVIVEWAPHNPDLLTVRLAGLRSRYPLSAAYIYHEAVEKHVKAERRAKKAARKAKQ